MLLPIVLLSVIATPFLMSAYILRKIDLAARKREQTAKLQLVDLFSLIFMIQLPLAIWQWIERGEIELAKGFGWLLVSVMIGAATLVWWTTIQTVAKAGISTVGDRLWISLLVIPVTYAGPFLILLSGVLAANGVSERQDYFSMVPFVVLVCLFVFSWRIVEKILWRRQQRDIADQQHAMKK